MKHLVVSSILAVSSLLAVSQVNAANVSNTFQVQITIQAACTITASNIDFGTVASNAASVADKTGNLNVNCTKGSPYDIALTSANTWKMINASNNIGYALYRDSAKSNIWNEVAANKYSGTGTGAVQPIPVYAAVTGSTNVPVGTYVDTVTATVTY